MHVCCHTTLARLPIATQRCTNSSCKVVSAPACSQNPFDRIPVDQTIEETMNPDTYITRGTKGFSLKWAAVERNYLTSEYRIMYLRQLRQIVGRGMSHLSHPYLHITWDEADVHSIVNLLDEDWTNHFDPNES